MEEIIKKAQKLLQENKPLLADDMLRKALKNYNDDELGIYASQLYALRGTCTFYMSNMENAIRSYWFAAQTAKILKNQLEYYSNYLFCLHYTNKISSEEIAQYAGLYGKMAEIEDVYSDYTPVNNKIKVAYISNDFREHAVANFVIPFLRDYDKNLFEVHVFCLNKADRMTEKFKQFNVIWHDVNDKAPGEIAEEIHANGIHILVDLGGHSAGGMGLMVMAYRPSPVQICGIGWLSTTGCDFVDYYLTDEFLGNKFSGLFSEKLIKLKNCFLCYEPIKEFPKINWKLKDKITFGVFSNFDKITDEQLILWQEILLKVPDSKLILKDTTAIITRIEAMKQRAYALGIDNVEIRSASENYLEEYNEIDIAFDTYPYEGGTTLCEALYMGVPMICLRGDSHSRNISASILHYVGKEELLADDESDYVEKAVSLANNTDRIKNYRTNMRSDVKSYFLLRCNNYIREIEEIFQNLVIII